MERSKIKSLLLNEINQHQLLKNLVFMIIAYKEKGTEEQCPSI
jgi:hypothetical protein